jgi:hypothetical protein
LDRPLVRNAGQWMKRAEAGVIRVQGTRLVLARVLWLSMVVLTLGTFLAALPARFEQLLSVTPSGDDALALLAANEAALLVERGVPLSLYALYFVAAEIIFAAVYAVMGIAIYLRASDERVAWVSSITLIAFGVLVPATPRVLDTPNSPWELPVHLVQNIGWISFATMFYLFPDGRFVPRWTRFFPIVFFAWAVAWLLEPLANPFNWPLWMALLGLLGLFGAGMLAQLYRYVFVSTPLQRLQTKWVVFAFAVATVGIGIFVAPLLLFPATREPGLARVVHHMIGIPIFSTALLTVPIGLDIAIRRHRLWDIDPLVRRTFIYVTLTAALALIYFGCVFVLQQLFVTVTGQRQNELVTVLSTLAIAALFVPVRNRIQDGIDRRFYRRKYDAQRVLQKFGETVRDETDLEKLTGELINVVHETMQPRSVTLWLKKDKSSKE